ncbi:MAG: PAS domain S-box protein [Desulfobacteraceae bacterium]|nr:MAG: PAS domain S-box protein [Desulfobacteraceae bacterium]
MKISAKLKLSAWVPVLIALVIAIFLLFSFRTLDEAREKSHTAHRIIQGIFYLNSMARSYLLYHEDRPKSQFLSEHSSISELIRSARFTNGEQQRLLEGIRRNSESMWDTFIKLVANSEHPDAATDTPLHKEADDRLGGRLLIQASDALSDALHLDRLIDDGITSSQKRISTLIFILIFSTTGPLTYVLMRVMKKIGASLSELRKGTEIVASGNLDHRIGMAPTDEIGELSRSFDLMTENLRETKVSRDALSKEVQERKRAEEALRDQREWLRVTLSSIGDAVIAADTGGRVTFINPVAQALTAWPIEEAMAHPIRNVFRIVNETTREPAEDVVERVLSAGNVVNLANHTALLTRDGREIPIEDSAAPIRDGAGNLIGVVLVFHDVTEKRRAQAALSESAEKLRIVSDFTYDWEYWRSQDNRFLYVSPSCERITGYTREEFLQDPDLYSRIIHPDDRERVLAHLSEDQLHRELCEIEFRIFHRDGGQRWIGHVCRPVLDDRGQPIGRRASNRDITGRKQAESALRDNEYRFRLLSETAGRLLATDEPQKIVEGLCREVMSHLNSHLCLNFLADEKDGMLYLNACAGIAESEAEEIEWPDHRMNVCARPGDRPDRKADPKSNRKSDQKPQRIVTEEIGTSPDPQMQGVKSFGIQTYACNPLMLRDRLIGTLSFGTQTQFSPEDLALMKTVADQVATAMERMRLVRELEKSRDSLEIRVQERTAELKWRAEQLSRLASELTLAEERERRRLAEILHDHLQQLLVGAKLSVESLAPSVSDDQQQLFHHACKMLMESIKISRSLTAELSPAVLYQRGFSAALEWLSKWMKEKYELSVELKIDPEIEIYREDMTVLLFQSVRELLFNVVKHARVNLAAVLVSKGDPHHLRIVVRDQGEGFDSDEMCENGGQTSGFGMFTIRERLELLGGRLEIESAPGKGSAFTLIAPLEKAESGQSEPEPRQGGGAAGDTVPAAIPADFEKRIRLMLVDDHIVMRQGLSTMLNSHPDIQIVAEAGDGEAAVQLARKHKPDVILMDIGMPKMNGIEATRIIHSKMPEIRIIALSMFEDSDIAAVVSEAGAAAYLTKTGNTKALLATIRGTHERWTVDGGR